MKKSLIIVAMASSMMFYLLSSCYKNNQDIQTIPRVSFRTEVVPIVTSGACGCHNNCNSSRQVRFSCKDTIFYDAISARANMFGTWVNGGTHPGGGDINFNPNEKAIIKAWVEQGEPYDEGAGCTVPTVVTYTKDIVPIYKTVCGTGGACHGGITPALTYDKMVEKKTTLEAMMSSGGATGHPGPPLSLSSCVTNTFTAWINQGMPK